MSTSNRIRAEASLVAELVSAGGLVSQVSVEGAFQTLIGALEQKSEVTPYGAIVARKDEPPTAAQAWRSCLGAWSRLAQFLGDLPEDSLQKTDWIAQLDWPEDLRLITHIPHHGKAQVKADDIPLFFDASNPTHTNVFIVCTASKFEEMQLPTRLTGLLADERVLIQVVGERGSPSGWLPAEKRAPQGSIVLSRSDDDAPADRRTLAWREWFVKNVKCLTAAQVAKEGGHQAKNTSATASRWVSEGKIFSVRHRGQLLYPAFQFQHGQPLPVMGRILRALGSESTGWDVAFFFATPNAYLNNDRPIDRLHDPKLEEELVRIADRYSHPADVF